MRALLASPVSTPILCVCFTNHALDQFLEGLLDAGIEGVVRVGGRWVVRPSPSSLQTWRAQPKCHAPLGAAVGGPSCIHATHRVSLRASM